MGSSHSQLGGQLAPQERPLGLYKDFCVPNQVTVIIRASIKSWSGNEYVVRDTSGVPVIKISGKALSVGNKKHCNGRPLFQIENKLLTMKAAMLGLDGTGNIILEVKKQQSFSMNFQASFRDPHSGRSQQLLLIGDQRAANGCVTLGHGGPVIAQIQPGPKEGGLGGHTHAVTVAPNVDIALMTALCVCLDSAMERRNNMGLAAIDL